MMTTRLPADFGMSCVATAGFSAALADVTPAPPRANAAAPTPEALRRLRRDKFIVAP
jgi:hypothetical protein